MLQTNSYGTGQWPWNPEVPKIQNTDWSSPLHDIQGWHLWWRLSARFDFFQSQYQFSCDDTSIICFSKAAQSTSACRYVLFSFILLPLIISQGFQQLAAQFEQLQVTSPSPYQSAGSPSPSPPIALHYTRSLSGITGTVFIGESHNFDLDSPPAGVLGIAAEKYLFAHGYQASAIWSIIHAFREANSSQDFTHYLCARGMPLLEAEYLFELISGRDVYLPDGVTI